jgi:exosortase A-associated hydrolase 2
MITTQAEFWTGPFGQLFRIMRSASKIIGYVVYLPPLFEDANRNRHVYTRSSTSVAELGYQTIIFDSVGTGDSQGMLTDVDLIMWQSEIIAMLKELKTSNPLPITLVACHSAALLLSPEILAQTDAVQLWHPEFNGKKFVQQFKRLAMVSSKPNNLAQSEHATVEIAGYQVSTQLLVQLSEQSLAKISPCFTCCYWFELLADGENMSLARANQLELVRSIQPKITIENIIDSKHWQATELVIPEKLLLRTTAVLGNASHG